MGKILNIDEVNKIKNDLIYGTSPKRRAAAKKIGKLNIKELENELLECYIKEKSDSRTWETQVEMIRALGKIKALPAIILMEEIIKDPKKDASTTVAATIAYIRLKRSDNNDATPIIELISKNPNRSILDGSLSVLAFDDMIPSTEQINAVLDFVEKSEKYLDEFYIKGTTDPRIHVLSASVNWDKNIPKLQALIDRASQNPRINQYMDRIIKGKKAPFIE